MTWRQSVRLLSKLSRCSGAASLYRQIRSPTHIEVREDFPSLLRKCFCSFQLNGCRWSWLIAILSSVSLIVMVTGSRGGRANINWCFTYKWPSKMYSQLCFRRLFIFLICHFFLLDVLHLLKKRLRFFQKNHTQKLNIFKWIQHKKDDDLSKILSQDFFLNFSHCE